MVFEPWIVMFAGLAYVGLLFGVATWVDRAMSKRSNKRRPRPLIYALSLAVYCTSWTYFGSVGVSANRGFDFIPVYLGPILVFALAYPLISRIIVIAKSQNISSIADFIAARYGKSESLGALIALIAVIGIIPYISIQLKALSFSIEAMIRVQGSIQPVSFGLDLALLVTLALAAFAILFGTRHVDTTEHQDGMIVAIAVESLVKLAAFLAVGLFVVYYVLGGFSSVFDKIYAPELAGVFQRAPDGGRWLTVTLLSACAILLLPRQFHVGIVENTHGSDVKRAAWLFPLYLIAINLFVAPIAMAGLLTLPGIDEDTYVLALPVAAQSQTFALIAFVGGVSAATAMVIVESIALSIMISNNLIVPWVLLRQGENNMFQRQAKAGQRSALIVIRRLSICAILLLAYIYYASAGNSAALAQTGLISFAAVAQFAPVFFGGMIWRGGTARGAAAGVCVGFFLWAYTLLIPSFIDSGWINPSLLTEGPLGIWALRPRQLFGLEFDQLTHGVLWSLVGNVAAFVTVSLMRPPSRIEQLQADAFLGQAVPRVAGVSLKAWRAAVNVGQLEETVARYVGEAKTRRAFSEMLANRQLADEPTLQADHGMISFSEHLLASAVGPASARLVLALLLERHSKGSRDAVQLLDDASAAIQHNRDVLQTALDNIPQGMVVYNKDSELVSWNAAVRDILNIPPSLLRIGTKLEAIQAFVNEHRRARPMGIKDLQQRRVDLQNASAKFRERLVNPDLVIDVHSSPLPDGGFVVSFTDVTASVDAAEALQRSNETLEQRVQERTRELMELNAELARAKADADSANRSKTRFFSAASHDILQPLNAARLFTSSLVANAGKPAKPEVVRNVDAALESVEDILSTVLDISRLDAGAVKPEISDFALDDIFEALEREFVPAARAKKLSLTFQYSKLFVRSDRRLLRRILQNLVSNSIKYSDEGKVVISTERNDQTVKITVKDTGRGIPENKLKTIFREFERLERDKAGAAGLGLGLSIVDRMCRVLRLQLTVSSEVGKGTSFSMKVPLGEPAAEQEKRSQTTDLQLQPSKMSILAIDNDESIVSGLRELLSAWGMDVTGVSSASASKSIIKKSPLRFDAILVDYHLGTKDDGITLAQQLRKLASRQLPAVLITADRSQAVKQACISANISYLTKPVKPAALRALLARLVTAPPGKASA